MAYRLRIDGASFRDRKGREVILHGINLAADAKNPSSPDLPSHEPLNFFDGDNVSFTERPFKLADAPTHFARLRKWGFNTLRYIFTWEAIEHAGPGKYDEAFIEHTIKVLQAAKRYGFYVFMDPHQDVWSRFTGGSGAPMWTLYACGLNPRNFLATEAALVQNCWPDPAKFPKMIWATNYNRLACATIYTLFWAGRDFAPKAIIDGVNIQDYLQDHYVDACAYLAKRINDAGGIDDDVVIAWESINEPNRCLVGYQDLTKIPSEQKLHKGTDPTPFQAMQTGSGKSAEVPTWDFGAFGPYQSGTALVDPKGVSAWLDADYDDSRYGWRRDPGWKLGSCIWAQHGVWNPSSDTVNSAYFAKDPKTGATIDYPYFTSEYFVPHFRKYRDAIRKVFPHTIMFCQGPVLEIPPALKGTEDEDPNMASALHWYDGVTLMNKKWNRFFNVDVIGVLRGKYLSPAFAVKLGESAIRNCFKEQHSFMRDEATDKLGMRPVVFTEFGIPYDMDDGYAYKTGDYSSQTRAMDSNYFGMEGAKVHNILWDYVATNTHQWGDQWNGEDLSIFSVDDRELPSLHLSRNGSYTARDAAAPAYSESQASRSASNLSTNKAQMRVTTNDTAGSSQEEIRKDTKYCRAAEAYIRPTPQAVHGEVISYGFDLAKSEFKLNLNASSPTSEDAPTEIFLPEFHFPRDFTAIEVSGGKWTLETDHEELGGAQRLKWWHASGNQTLQVKGIRETGTEPEDASVLSQCRDNCKVM